MEKDMVEKVLNRKLIGAYRAKALIAAFDWGAHELPSGGTWGKEYGELQNNRDLSPEARAYLEKLIEPEPKMQSFWVNIYLYRGAYTVGGAVRSSAEEAAQARHDLGREYVGAVEIKLPILQKEQQS